MKSLLLAAALSAITITAVAAVPPFGTWEWVETETSRDEFTRPEDVGYTVQYEFKGDMTYVEYHDGVIHEEGVFWVRDVEFQGLIITALNLDFGGVSPDVCAYWAGGTTLEMYWGYNPDSGMPSFPVELYATRGPVGSEDTSWGGIKALYR